MEPLERVDAKMLSFYLVLFTFFGIDGIDTIVEICFWMDGWMDVIGCYWLFEFSDYLGCLVPADTPDSPALSSVISDLNGFLHRKLTFDML